MTEAKNELNLIELNLPSHWASALINADESGLEDEEIEELNDTLQMNGVENCPCVGCSDEPFFTHQPETFSGLACDCLIFTFQKLD